MKKTKGLQGRWLRNTLSIMLVLVLLCVTALSVTVAAYYYSNTQEDLEARARSSMRVFAGYAELGQEEYVLACAEFVHSAEFRDVTELQFVDAEGRILASSQTRLSLYAAVTDDVTEAFDTQILSTYTGEDPASGKRMMATSVPLLREGGELIGVMRFVTSLEEVDRQIFFFAVTVLLVGALLLLVVYASGRYYVRSILIPVSEITATAKRIAAGGYGVQIQRQYDDEIGELTDTINDMSNKISQTEKMQAEFISSVSHELRTPLTAISGWSETLLDAGGSVEAAEARRGLNIILRESHRLTMMVEELLEFTRMQDGRFKLNVCMSDLRSEFEDTVFMYGSRLQQEGIDLQYLDNDDDIPEIPCDTARMRQVFLNILDNAAKHGGEGGKITAQINREADAVVVRIRDFGAGIAEEELPLIKKKFYKGSSKARGSGIGLAVCEEIVSMHGGSLEISNADGGGALVTIRLPITEV